jgi:beta-glucosidase
MAALAPCSPWNPFDRALTRIATQFYNHSLIEALLTGRVRLVFPFRRPVTLDLPIKGKIDFLGVNYYTRVHLRFNPFKKMGVELKHQDIDGNGLTDLGWEIHPDGLARVLRHASRLAVPLIITENGIATSDDGKKTRFIKKHVDILQRCRKEGMDIRGYFYWSLMDNYEWLQGFNARFGLYQVDFDTLERIPTETAAYYGSLIKQRQ